MEDNLKLQEPNKIAKAVEGIESGDLKDTVNNYLIVLINSTDKVVKLARTNKGPWVPTQHIGRTCDSTDYQNCAANQAYRPLLYEKCGISIQVDVAWQEANGSWWHTGWDAFNSDCTYAGGIIQLVP